MGELLCHYFKKNLSLLYECPQKQHLLHTQNTSDECLMLNLNISDCLSKYPSQLSQSFLTDFCKVPFFKLRRNKNKYL